ncbi:MAG: sulfotransferase family 2 domain-containing protein [Alphaproteobacteria bacterium]|nr:sulfotransferase family 2 domain-containing protein [Alphaproteobacteria bacterium]
MRGTRSRSADLARAHVQPQIRDGREPVMTLSPQEHVIARTLRSKRPTFMRMRLAYGMFISTRYRYLFVEIPKSGATTTKTLLWQIEGYGPEPRGSIHDRPVGDPRPSPVTVSPEVAEAALFSSSHIRFCLWRDPVRRLASAYRDKLQLGRDASPAWDFWRRKIAAAHGISDSRDITFDRFAAFVCAQHDSARDPHWMSQWRLALADHLDYDFVVRLDSYARDLSCVLDAVGVPARHRPSLDARLHASDSNLMEISEATAALIRSAYEQDYALPGRAARCR